MEEHKSPLTTNVYVTRLASGDNEGRVVLWDVTGGAAEASLDDPAQVRS